jgi:hypothetical protein
MSTCTLESLHTDARDVKSINLGEAGAFQHSLSCCLIYCAATDASRGEQPCGKLRWSVATVCNHSKLRVVYHNRVELVIGA